VSLTDPEVVRRDYESESRLLGRRSIYEGGEGPSAWDVIWARIVEASPRSVLEVGPGPGELSERMSRELDADVVAIDVSPRMVELTRGRGVDAQVGDVQDLPFADASFDLVVAGWVLFHPSDLDRAVSEIARVVRPGGRLIAATNSDYHLAELWSFVGHSRIEHSFSLENGEQALRRHFDDVSMERVEGWVTFSDTDAVRGYIRSSIICGHLADSVPALAEPLRARRLNAIFISRKD
jgi:SAM-dependent methyltransferase